MNLIKTSSSHHLLVFSMKLKSLILFVLLSFFLLGFHSSERILMLNKSTFKGGNFKEVSVSVNDSIKGGSLLKRYSDGLLHSYARRIHSEVCMEKECRPLDVILYWSLTGRYLGFELPEGEFLSKTDHVKFQENDYQQIHKLLSDPISPLGNYSLNELVPVVNDDIDAVSSATNLNVKDYIVDGAVYTTYVIWHLVHGICKDEIQETTKLELDEKILIEIFSSENKDDIVWALDNIPSQIEWNDKLVSQLLILVNNENFMVAERAIRIFDYDLLANEKVQLQLFSSFNERGYLMKRRILECLEDVPVLSPSIKNELINGLPEYNGSLVKNILGLLSIHRPATIDDELAIASLMNHNNRYIARKAFQFFEDSNPENKKIEKIMKKYKRRLN